MGSEGGRKWGREPTAEDAEDAEDRRRSAEEESSMGGEGGVSGERKINGRGARRRRKM